MKNKKPQKIEKLFEGFKLQLKNEGEYFSNLSDHNGEKGRLNESHLKKVLRQYLPEKYGIGTGFIVSNKSLEAKDNPQLDIIIYDKINNAPLYKSETFGIYPVEMVYAYIEVKTTLNISEIKSAFEINKRIRALAEDKHYIGQPFIKIAPRFYIFAYKSNPKNKAKMVQNVVDSFRTNGKAHAHGIYCLDKDMLIARQALYKENVVKVMSWGGPLTFARFITNLVDHCEKMKGTDFMPRTDLQKYLG